MSALVAGNEVCSAEAISFSVLTQHSALQTNTRYSTIDKQFIANEAARLLLIGTTTEVCKLTAVISRRWAASRLPVIIEMSGHPAAFQ
ncbi:hypothetical protein NPIL_437151 [Nephila pilipes]|uniref:Uncharacterized protein n=1 Tax=Nephila pilipes TaxID=299642 RepID=A0A8X6Q6W3_NEPPI|nr:hypothetical protein NPIL_437151 [Nephila pilipes]